MAVTVKTRMVPARKEEYKDKLICELCGKETEYFKGWGVRDDFQVSETEVSMKEGERFPESGTVEKTVFDICPDCFKCKLIPWLKSQGAKPRTVDESY